MAEDALRITTQALAPGIWRCAGPNAMCSSVVFAGEQAVLVADGMVTPGLARQVKDMARRLTGRHPRFLLTTHGDSDHILGNQEFWPESVLLSHRLTRDRLINNGERELAVARARRPELAADLAEVRIVAAEVAFEDQLEIDLGGMRLECLYVGPAHTPGDVVVWVPEHRFLFTSDVVFSRIFPVVRNADTEGWLRALDRLAALRPAIVAPGHGEVGGAELVDEMKELLTAIREEVRAAVRQGLPLEKALETVSFPQYRGLPRADERIPETIQKLYKELEG